MNNIIKVGTKVGSSSYIGWDGKLLIGHVINPTNLEIDWYNLTKGSHHKVVYGIEQVDSSFFVWEHKKHKIMIRKRHDRI